MDQLKISPRSLGHALRAENGGRSLCALFVRYFVCESMLHELSEEVLLGRRWAEPSRAGFKLRCPFTAHWVDISIMDSKGDPNSWAVHSQLFPWVEAS